jgi:hypothetical protein
MTFAAALSSSFAHPNVLAAMVIHHNFSLPELLSLPQFVKAPYTRLRVMTGRLPDIFSIKANQLLLNARA